MIPKIEDDYLQDKFINIPRIIADQRELDFFPGLIDRTNRVRKTEFARFGNNIYLDAAATTPSPASTIRKIMEYRLNNLCASTHGSSKQAKAAREKLEEARSNIKNFLHAQRYHLAFTAGTTHSSISVAQRFPFQKGDLLLLTMAEHNSQIISPRNIAANSKADVDYIHIDKEGKLDLDNLEKRVMKQLRKNTKSKILLNVVHTSNVSGVINPIKEIRQRVGSNVFIYLDLAQSAGHMPLDLDDYDVDFAGLSAHKMYGPKGIGALLVNKRSEPILNNTISGGGALKLISRHFEVYEDAPARFEPGTPNLEGAIEWSYAVDFLNSLGIDNIASHEKELTQYLLQELPKIPDVKVYGPAESKERSSIILFNIGYYLRRNYDDVTEKLDQRGISVRSGCFCAHIGVERMIGELTSLANDGRTMLMKAGIRSEDFKLPGAVRLSTGIYNTLEDMYHTVVAIKEIRDELL